jgi:aldehyde dehydrogenase (NAD+)/betaine-aldehyde dehydrogenase
MTITDTTTEISTLFIGGTWCAAEHDGTFDVVNPSTGQTFAKASDASRTDVDAAVAAARASLDGPWKTISPAERGRILWRVAELIDEHADELAALESGDVGQPINITRGINIPAAAEHFRYFAGWPTKIQGSTNPVSIPGVLQYTRREPLGVCALIVPWNFPFMTTAWKVAPALAAGNSVVIKPAEQTPLSTIRLVELLAEAGVPDGVVNLVTGGPDAGRCLSEHSDVDKVSFTGSTAVGREIVRASAGNLKRVTLELGGKSPSIITAKADLDAAVAGNLMGNVLNTGQVCAAYTRFYVHSSIVEEFTEKLLAAAAELKIGAADDAATVLGPLNSAEHLARVESYVRSAREEGASVRSVSDLPADSGGYYFAPTVVTDVRDVMKIVREEIFGPVMPVMSYDDLDDLVRRANDTDYGLAAAVWTSDLNEAHEIAARLEAGSVYVNMLPTPDPAAPWGGFKASGWGIEMGPGAIHEYSQEKGVWIGGLAT